MITLFTYIADHVQDRQQLFEDEGNIMQALLNHGFLPQEADAALTLMQRLVQIQDEESFDSDEAADLLNMRMMNREERDRFSVEAFSFITKLTSLGLLSEGLREDIVERALTMYPDRIELDQIKNLVAYALFSNTRDVDDNAQGLGRRIRKTAWN